MSINKENWLKYAFQFKQIFLLFIFLQIIAYSVLKMYNQIEGNKYVVFVELLDINHFLRHTTIDNEILKIIKYTISTEYNSPENYLSCNKSIRVIH